MADFPPEVETPDTPNSRFLFKLWDLLERATDISTASDVLDRLDEIQRLCEEAVAHLRRGPDPDASA